jgi:hypothetical protein
MKTSRVKIIIYVDAVVKRVHHYGQPFSFDEYRRATDLIEDN